MRILVTKHENRMSASTEDLIADYKARGLTAKEAWDRFIIDRALKPEIGAKECHRLFAIVPPKRLDSVIEIDFVATHFDMLSNRFCQITTDSGDMFHLVWDNGATGSNPPSLPPEEARFIVLSSKLVQAIEADMVIIEWPHARIVAPPAPESLTDSEWLALLSGAGEIGKELSRLGFSVEY